MAWKGAEGRCIVNGASGAYEYNLTDHLGNVRAVVGADGTVKQKSNYYPFGGVFAKSGSPDNKYLYNGKELQEGTGWLDYGRRMLSAELGRFMIQDRFAEKYSNITPYHYCANDPIKHVDVRGDSIMVLNAPAGAGGTGHLAILIQNKKGKWRLWSKNGTTGSSGENDKDLQEGVGDFESPEKFMTSKLNPVGKDGQREYTEGYLIPATPEEDKSAEVGVQEELSKDYNVLGSNCAKTVQSSLKAANKQDGSPSKLSTMISSVIGTYIGGSKGVVVANTINSKVPRLIYKRIKKQNNGKVIK